MNITIITCVLPWKLQSGGAQAQFNMIDQLRKKHHITLIFPEDFQNKISAMKELQLIWPDVKLVAYPIWRQLLYPRFVHDKAERAFRLTFTPDNERFKVQRVLMHYGVYPSWDFVRFIKKIIRDEHTDIIQTEFYPCLRLAKYLPANIKKIFIHHELKFVKNERSLMVYRPTEKEIEWMKELKKEELDDLNEFDHIVTLTQQDKDTLLQEGITKPISVSPAAVNTQSCPYKSWNHKLSFVGSFLHQPNQEGIDWYMKEVIPLMRNIPPLDIIGKGWPDKYKTPHVTTIGYIEDLSKAIHGSTMIVPILSGSGMRMKILEAAAMSMPIVTTSIGVEGLKFKHRESCLVADTPHDFALAIEQLTDDAQLCQTLGEQANSVFLKNYSKEVLAEVRNKIYV